MTRPVQKTITSTNLHTGEINNKIISYNKVNKADTPYNDNTIAHGEKYGTIAEEPPIKIRMGQAIHSTPKNSTKQQDMTNYIEASCTPIHEYVNASILYYV